MGRVYCLLHPHTALVTLSNSVTPSIQSFPSALQMAFTMVVGVAAVILCLMTPRSKAAVVASSASALGRWTKLSHFPSRDTEVWSQVTVPACH